ncbi:MAG: hypothetical protein R3Y04_05475 [Rikenellaceae bacterium]
MKHYIALNRLYLSTTVNVDGKQRLIEFKNGILKPNRRNGIFRTDDQQLQQAIEQDGSYGKSFVEYIDPNTPQTEESVKIVSKPKRTRSSKKSNL